MYNKVVFSLTLLWCLRALSVHAENMYIHWAFIRIINYRICLKLYYVIQFFTLFLMVCKCEEIFQYLKMNTVFWKVSVELFNYFEFGTQMWINNRLYSRIKSRYIASDSDLAAWRICLIAIIRLFFKHTLLRFLLKTLKTWFNAFLFTDYLFKREIVCKYVV